MQVTFNKVMPPLNDLRYNITNFNVWQVSKYKRHCGGCLNKRARGYAARSSTRNKIKQPNKKARNERRPKGAFSLNRLQIAPFFGRRRNS